MKIVMWLSCTFFVYMISLWFPGFHLIPESPVELILEGIVLVMLFQIAVIYRMTDLEEKINKKLDEQNGPKVG